MSSFIAHTDMVISFFHYQFTIRNITPKRVIGKGMHVKNLYVLKTASACEEFPSNLVSLEVWHNHLGYLSKKVLQCLKCKLYCQKFVLNTLDPCCICSLAKKKRLSFISNHHMQQFPFDLSHCDVWGPFNTFTTHDQQYFFYSCGWLYTVYLGVSCSKEIWCIIFFLTVPHHDWKLSSIAKSRLFYLTMLRN